MKAYTFEITKKISVTVEAETYIEAIYGTHFDIGNGEYDDLFLRAPPDLKLTNERKVP